MEAAFAWEDSLLKDAVGIFFNNISIYIFLID
jgi:hypothetical protein